MTLYDHLSMPKEYAVEKPIDKKELLYPAFSDQQNEVLFNSVNEAVLKYRIGTTTVFDVVEVSVNEYQYFYFLPLSIQKTNFVSAGVQWKIQIVYQHYRIGKRDNKAIFYRLDRSSELARAYDFCIRSNEL